MGNTVKIILVVLGLIYIISPVDFVPGPIDDALLFILGAAALKAKSIGKNKDNDD